jgi:beta-fructofuranosidase
MIKWEYLGDFIDQNNRMRYDFEDLSCPDFFQVGDKNMLLFISHNLGSQYYLGDFKDDTFIFEKHGRMNWPGGTFFAPEELMDDKGRNIIWGWVLERKPKHLEDKGWSGVMSMPRVLSISKEGELLINPPKEVEKLRLDGINEKNITLAANQTKTLDIKGKSLEIKTEFKGGSQSEYGVKVFCSPDGKEETIIKYVPSSKEIVIDFINSSKNGPVKMRANCMGKPSLEEFGDEVSEQRVPFELKKGETLQFDIFIDKAIIEVFVNGRLCITQVVYPELENSNEVKIFSGNEKIKVESVKAWKMATTNFY